MQKVVLLGFGNVGFHTAKALEAANTIDLLQVYNRNNKTLFSEIKAETTTNISEIKQNADVYIIAIPDDAIQEFTKSLPLKNKLVVHTSGSAAMNAIGNGNRKGVFYPLQTFSKNTEVDFKTIPILIESEHKEDSETLRVLASAISYTVKTISSTQREKLHLAAVFVNNFVNELYHISEEIVQENELDFKLLQPLILETAAKVTRLTPKEAQTGPAKRKDEKTLKKHVHLLHGKQAKKIYKMLTEAILKRYKN